MSVMAKKSGRLEGRGQSGPAQIEDGEEKVVFIRLTFEVQRQICVLMVNREMERLKQMGYTLMVEPPALEFLIREGYHRTLGARPMRNTVERYLQDAIVQDVMGGGEGSGNVIVQAGGGSLCITK